MTTSRHTPDSRGHEVAVADRTTGDPGEDHGHDDAHADSMPLGPIDVIAWGAGLLGVVLGLAVVWAFALATATVGVTQPH